MSLPPGYEEEDKCCRLKKALYELKQSLRAWFERPRNIMMRQQYTQGNEDHTLFIRRKSNNITILLVYVDDMIVTVNDCEEINRLKKMLATEFELKDLGRL